MYILWQNGNVWHFTATIFRVGKGILTDMKAIRRDEELDNLHSCYVDQWDWEKVIDRSDRNEDYLKAVVKRIVGADRNTWMS